MKKQKRNLKSKQSKMIFKDRIDRLSTEHGLRGNFFPEILHFRFPHSIVTIRAKTCDIIFISHMTSFQINFVLLASARNIFGNYRSCLP